MKTYLTLILMCGLTTACSKISSNQVDPSAIYGSISVDREGSQVSVTNTFFVGGGTGTIVTIDPPATIDINGSAATQTVDPLINLTTYTANLVASSSPILS